MKKPKPEPPGPGQESVWDYPRPPRMERTSSLIQVDFAGVCLAESTRALRILETSHPPVYYIPPEDVRTDLLVPAPGGSSCEWKGAAAYWTVRVDEGTAEKAAWSYPDPAPPFRELAGHLAFYCHLMDACRVDGEAARPQPGAFYGGWITSRVTGPFKGEAGSWGW